ncbi:glycine receptor subunit alpha-2 [Eurytemora carolleeae]|uniref:glycine receptor subunit alpha-2 n=1 Tax=Eurytemora carolleeae TaxID=1294199 RepID=UPI000C76DC81|nr:glycine receptor subunit alpha-2 [Eurytemora carolleeae]|eukprot:XP_023327258.1 glycine receptor subunit alpha-2-like [Eurytemora affinis]
MRSIEAGIILCCLTCSHQLSTSANSKFCAKGQSICIPEDYSKFDPPNDTQTVVNVGIDIKDIPKINDKDFSVTLNAFFVVRWQDKRLVMDKEKIILNLGEEAETWIPVDVSFIKEFWLPDAEILNLKEFKTLDVLSKLEGLWLNTDLEIMYAVATRITFICPMTFNSFPLDVQICHFQVGSFNYDNTKMVFNDEFIADETKIRSVLDYSIHIDKLPEDKQNYMALTGNFSVAGFQLTLKRKVSHYIITCYLPSGMFVIVSWISFLIPPDIVPGRMTLLITVFLVLVNIFNTITTNIPKAEGLTAIEAWVIVCVLFVFGALVEYAGILLKMKVQLSMKPKKNMTRCESVDSQIILHPLAPENGTNGDEKSGKKKKKRPKTRAEEKLGTARLDLTFLVIFPCLFLLFNIAYWLSFLYILPE